MNRRGFLGLLAGAALAPLAVLAKPKPKFAWTIQTELGEFSYHSQIPQTLDVGDDIVLPANPKTLRELQGELHRYEGFSWIELPPHPQLDLFG